MKYDTTWTSVTVAVSALTGCSHLCYVQCACVPVNIPRQHPLAIHPWVSERLQFVTHSPQRQRCACCEKNETWIFKQDRDPLSSKRNSSLNFIYFWTWLQFLTQKWVYPALVWGDMGICGSLLGVTKPGAWGLTSLPQRLWSLHLTLVMFVNAHHP